MPYTATPVWSLPVNWADGVLERLEWKTDVMISESGDEQRVSRRLHPRRTFEAQFLLNKEDRQYFNQLAGQVQGKDILIPIWHDVTRMTAEAVVNGDTMALNTRYREFTVGGKVFIRGPNARTFEVATIIGVDANGLEVANPIENYWPKGTMVYPAKIGRIAGSLRPVKKNDRIFILTTAFQLRDDSPFPPSQAIPSHRGLAVIRHRPDDSEDQEFEYQRNLSELDNLFGKPDVYDVRGGPVLHQTHTWAVKGIVEAYELRKTLYSLGGRRRAIYLPTFMDDMTLAAPIEALNSFIDIINIGVTRGGEPPPGRTDIRIEINDGSVFYRTIESSIELSSTVERIALNASLGRDVPIGAVIAISYMMVARLDQDSVEVNHASDSEGLTITRVNFYGPTLGTELPIPYYTSKPYPIQALDELAPAASEITRAYLWETDWPDGMDITLTIANVSMPTVVAYRGTIVEDGIDISMELSNLQLISIPIESTIVPDEAIDISMSLASLSLITIPIIPYVLDDEAIDISLSLTQVTLS